MSAQVPTVELSPIQLAAQDNSCLEIIENYLMNLSHDPKYTDDLILSIQAYIVADNKDGNKSYKALALLAGLAKVNDGRKAGIFKCVGQIKNDPQFLDLVAKYTPDLQVSGGNERGTIVTVGSTATEVVNTPKPTKSTKGTKVQKPAIEDAAVCGSPTHKRKEKAPKKEKAAKVLPPMPTIADLAQLEAMDRKSLMSAMSAVNCHVLHTGVKGNGKTDDILKALAKHVLGIDNYQPVAKPVRDSANARSAKGSKAPKELVPLDMPTDLQWSEVKNMKFRELQGLAKIFRSHGLYQGNLAGKGVTKDFLLTSIKEILRGMGHEIIEANMSAPSELKPTLERSGTQSDLIQKANVGLAMYDQIAIAPDWNAIMAA